jgi:hypothetical protein
MIKMKKRRQNGTANEPTLANGLKKTLQAPPPQRLPRRCSQGLHRPWAIRKSLIHQEIQIAALRLP